MSLAERDERMMQAALRLARRGLYSSDPNPRVGCVIARHDRIVGRGWHRRAGEAHAEVHALAEAGDLARGADCYVTLEPCDHHGRTPPCSAALVAAGIRRLVIAAADPHRRAAGGAERLAAAGIEVVSGVLAAGSRALNIGFFSRHERHRPWVRLKLAISLDGRTAAANGQSQWLTGEAARADVQRWRARASAILTGGATVRADNPRLDVRLGRNPRQPLRLILSRQGDLDPAARIFAPPGRVVVYLTAADTAPALAATPIEVRRLPGNAADPTAQLTALLHQLAADEINELHVEAGATLSGLWLGADLVDELIVYLAPVLLGDRARPLARLPGLERFADRRHWRLHDHRRCGDDIRLIFRRPEAPCSAA